MAVSLPKSLLPRALAKPTLITLLTAAVIVLVIVALATREMWLPIVHGGLVDSATTAATEDDHEHADPAHEEHAGHEHAGHAHEGHEATDSLELSPQARATIGLKTGEVALGAFQRTLTLPAVVRERPGVTQQTVTALLTGLVTDVFVAEGQAVTPGEPLFVLRLTQEDLVQSQTDYLKLLEAVDVEDREIKRLESIASGVIAGKVVLERKYEKQKIEGQLRAQRQALLLHGLTEPQVDAIAKTRRLFREMTITAPQPHHPNEPDHFQRRHSEPLSAASAPISTAAVPLVVQHLNAQPGDYVQAGATLAALVDLQVLHLEGLAFEQDAAELAEAARQNVQVSAVPETGATDAMVTGLNISHISNEIDTTSRTLLLHIELPNAVVADRRADDVRFVVWRFKPGQRMQMRVPVETWTDQIVLPVEAVAQEGVENYVFCENGDHFDRRPVQVRYRDQHNAVIANDGSLLPGETVALNSATQLQMALQNKAGGGVDPHAGHQH